MAYIDDITELYDLAVIGKIDHRLGPLVEATFPLALNKGAANGVAAVNASGQVIDASGRPMAVIGTTAGTAADAAAVATAVAGATAAATAAANAAATKVASVNGTVSGAAFFATMPTEAELVAMNLPNNTVFFTPGP